MSAQDDCKLFVGGLADSVTEQALRDVFTGAGLTVVQVSVPRDRATGRGRGFGFVTLGSSEEAETARNTLNGKVEQGQAISVRPFQSRNASGPRTGPPPPSTSASLYVANLPFDATEAQVRQVFEDKGISVADVRLPRDAGKGKGFGFITLSKADETAKAVSDVDGADLNGRAMVVKAARPRGAPPEPRSSHDDSGRSFSGAGRPDSPRRRPETSDAPPAVTPDWEEPPVTDRRRAQKPKKKEVKTKTSGRPRSSRDRERASENWSRRYDRWDDD